MGVMFTRKERRMVDALREMGYARRLANVLVYFSKHDNGRCKDIQSVTSLRQPEVSMALKIMMEKGWVDVRVTKGGPGAIGRPMSDYFLKRPFAHIVSEIAEREVKDLERKRAVVDDLLQGAQ